MGDESRLASLAEGSGMALFRREMAMTGTTQPAVLRRINEVALTWSTLERLPPPKQAMARILASYVDILLTTTATQKDLNAVRLMTCHLCKQAHPHVPGSPCPTGLCELMAQAFDAGDQP